MSESQTDDSPVWTDPLLRNPHAVADKRSRVQKMFAAIAPSYDLNNRLHSLWMDQHWRRKAVKLATLKPTDVVVDVACGTGDLAIRFATELRRLRGSIHRSTNAAMRTVGPGDPWPTADDGLPILLRRVIGIDFTYEMLPIARRKAPEWSTTFSTETMIGSGSFDPLRFINGDAMSLPLPDACCDVVSIAFGIRNVADPLVALKEFHRVLRPGGRVIVLEFSLPTNPVLRGMYNFYFRKVLPRTATLISRDKTGAYKYLPESVNTFISRDQMLGMMSTAGFTQPEQHPLTFGVCVCYRGVKA